MVVLLIVGLWKRRLWLISCWLIFSVIGIVVDILFFIWTISTSESIAWRGIVHFTLLYLGIVVEWLCIYIVYKYYLEIGSIAENPVEKTISNISINQFEQPSRRSNVRKSKESQRPVSHDQSFKNPKEESD
ncbi:uncharacterized protein LOC116806476 [Drosophila grimshawi]|uniref:uncharacterized protein LOC116806476 n=1 Tax=Drosophila grimshawi TaxID=7222 RepID=UPI001C936DB9|nr:uncharacterized protein LOC116806476 [Drosophila grimshawi]